MKCLLTKCTKETDKRFCSINCRRIFYSLVFRKRTKLKAIEYKGGKCERCGYNKCISALEFHHRNPQDKLFAISSNGTIRPWKDVQQELDKCQIICSNCHRELHHIQYEDIAILEYALKPPRVLKDRKKKCVTCFKDTINSKYCSNECRNIGRTQHKINPDELLNKVKELDGNVCATARYYKVSENCIRKKLKKIHKR